MAPLFYDFIERQQDRVQRLMMMICVLRFRPRGWFSQARRYILSEDKNSFYLSGVYQELRRQLRIGFLTEGERAEIRELIGVTVARLVKGAKNPNRKLVAASMKAALGGE